jgi:hypothetical protein
MTIAEDAIRTEAEDHLAEEATVDAVVEVAMNMAEVAVETFEVEAVVVLGEVEDAFDKLWDCL